MSVFGEIYTTGKNFYIAGGSDGSDKSHLCPKWINCKIDCRYELFLGFEPVVGFECRKGAEVCSCGERKRCAVYHCDYPTFRANCKDRREDENDSTKMFFEILQISLPPKHASMLQFLCLSWCRSWKNAI